MGAIKIEEHIKRYVSFSKSDILILNDSVKRDSFLRNDFITTKDEICQSLLFVEKGCLRMFFIDDKNQEVTTQFAVEGWWLSDFFSFIQQTQSEYWIQAIEPVQLVSINRKAYANLLDKLPQLNTYFLTILQRYIAASQYRIKFLFGLHKQKRIAEFRAFFPDFMSRASLYMIESYLGIENSEKVINEEFHAKE